MRVRRLIGGFAVAVIVAAAMTQTLGAVYVSYCDYMWWALECWMLP